MMDIDIVVLWVDGNDPAWILEKNMYSPAVIDDSNSVNRFRDWGLMRYWFRAIDTFLPWVRTIHFVTWGHLPSFLNLSHPKLHIVRHKDYIPAKWLPTFSANPLEMNMHRIPGLSEHFIYFNDDMFVLRPMKKIDFFKNGFPCTQATEIPLGFIGRTQVWNIVAANDLGLINEHFEKKSIRSKNIHKYFNLKYRWYDNLRTSILGVLFPDSFVGFKNFHCPAVFCKSTFEEIWDAYQDVLEATSSHKFRDREDVNQWLAVWWQVASGRFHPRRINNRVYTSVEDHTKDVCDDIIHQKYEMICIEDNLNDDKFNLVSEKLINAFNILLPRKCSFEK